MRRILLIIILLLLLLFSACEQTNEEKTFITGAAPTSDLILYFPMNHTGTTCPIDYAPDANDNSMNCAGTVSNYLSYVTGINGNAALLIPASGSPDGMSTGTDAGITLASGDNFTVCLLTKPYDSGIEELVFRQGSDELNLVRKTDTDWQMQINGQFKTLSNSNHAAGSLRHVCFAFDNSADTLYYYENGSLSDSVGTSTDEPVFTNSNLNFFHRDYNKYYNGTVQHFRFYTKLLTATEINDTYLADAVATAEVVNLSNGLVAWYSFDSDYSDENNLLADWTLQNTPTITTGLSKVGAGSVNLTSSSAALYGPSIASHVSDYPFTIGGWVYVSSWSGNRRIFAVDGSGYNSVMGIANEGGTNNAYLQSGSSLVSATGVLTNGDWNQVIAVYYNSSNMSLYIDGVFITSGAAASWDSKYNTLVAGMYSDGLTSDYLGGYLDEVFLYNRSLSQAEITSLNNGGAGLSYQNATGTTPEPEPVVDCYATNAGKGYKYLRYNNGTAQWIGGTGCKFDPASI